MNYEFERHLRNAREQRDNRAIEAWLNLRGLFNNLAEGGIVQELPREINAPQEPFKTASVESSPLIALRRARREELYINRHQSSVGIDGQLVKQVRKASKLTQKELAKHIGVSQALVSEIEQDVDFVVTVGAEIASRFSGLFQIDIGKLVPYSEDIDRVKGFQLLSKKDNVGE